MERSILYIFRRTTQFFSIENIFSMIAGELARSPGLTTRRVDLPRSGLGPSSFLDNGRFIRRQKSDLYHITGDVHYISLFLPGKKTILTIHDCVFMYQSSGIKRIILKKLLLDWPVRRCRLITTISEKTRQDILSFTGCPEHKVVVIPNPVNQDIVLREKAFDSQTPVLLFIGNTPNKNLGRVIEALKGLPCRLDIVGRQTEADEQKLSDAGIQYRLFAGLSGAEMAERYALADIILFPSTFEGFGLPIIEGQKAGRVVLTSDISPMKEVAGEGACLVNPNSVASIRQGVLKLINDAEYRTGLIGQGFGNVRKYEPHNIAQRYRAIYDQIFNTK